MSTVYEALRMLNVALFIAAAIMLWVRVNDTWRLLNVGTRRFSIGLLMLFAVLAYGSAESYVLHAGTGPRIPLITAAMGGVIHGLWNTRHDEHPTRKAER